MNAGAYKDTPILICVYRRLEKVLAILEALEKIRPATIYISANAPKNDEESIFCDAIKKAIDNISWDCTVHKKYETIHIPDCSTSVVKGIDWFFANVTQGIILEDDCVPTPSFIRLCSFLLHKYEYDHSVYHISGTNTTYDHSAPPRLLFTRFALPCWGWATWRRCWEKYTPQMNNWERAYDLIKSFTHNFPLWQRLLQYNMATKKGWDLQWNVDIWVNEGKILIPSYNLISNIGFDKLSTFTTNPNNTLSYLPVKEFPLPAGNVIIDADSYKQEANIITLVEDIIINSQAQNSGII